MVVVMQASNWGGFAMPLFYPWAARRRSLRLRGVLASESPTEPLRSRGCRE